MSFQILQGDALAQLRTLPNDSVHTCVTSPPYWGLRDYGVDGQIGLEDSLDDWVAKMVEVFREVRRVLRHDGTLWLNLGDAYAGSWGAQSRGDYYDGTLDHPSRRSLSAKQILAHPKETGTGSLKNTPGLKNKDLMGQPWRVAFALQAVGWYLRSDIVWSKSNPMPESIKDRPTKSHEYVFLLAKSERYFYDLDAIREPYKPESLARRAYIDRGGHTGDRRGEYQPKHKSEAAADALPRGTHRGGSEIREGKYYDANPAGRNRRSVWEISTKPFPEAHFATFPEALVEPCVMAGTSEGGCCANCGSPRVRRTELGELDREHQMACGADSNGEYHGVSAKHGETAEDYDRLKKRQQRERKKATGAGQNPSEVKARILAGMREKRTVGWDPTCECGGETTPCTVLDPFSGSGTSGVVAIRHRRRYIGIELNPEYAAMSERRIGDELLARSFGDPPANERERELMSAQATLFDAKTEAAHG